MTASMPHISLSNRIFTRTKINRAILCHLLSAVIAIASCLTLSGCSASQLSAGITDMEQKLPQLATLGTAVLVLIDPNLVPQVEPLAAKISTDAQLATTLINGLKNAPSADSLAKLNALTSDMIENINAIVNAVSVKNPQKISEVNGWAQLAGLIINDIAAFVASNAPKTTLSQLPALFGWHISGIDLMAIDGSKLPMPAKNDAKKSGWTSREIAKAWNKIVSKSHPEVRLNVPKKHIMGLPIPMTGGK